MDRFSASIMTPIAGNAPIFHPTNPPLSFLLDGYGGDH